MVLRQVHDDDLVNNFFKRDYHDRGMLKWGGFYLSDHTSALTKMHAAEKVEAPLPKQPLSVVSERLAVAWRTHQPVHLQLKVMDDNRILAKVDGIVVGVHEDNVVIQLASGRWRELSLTEIRCVGNQSKKS